MSPCNIGGPRAQSSQVVYERSKLQYVSIKKLESVSHTRFARNKIRFNYTQQACVCKSLYTLLSCVRPARLTPHCASYLNFEYLFYLQCSCTLSPQHRSRTDEQCTVYSNCMQFVIRRGTDNVITTRPVEIIAVIRVLTRCRDVSVTEGFIKNLQ